MGGEHRDSNTTTAVVPQLADAPAPAYELTVVEGPDRAATLLVEGNAPRVFVGTSPICQLRLTDRAVSRRHAAFGAADGGLRVVDLGSKNGTMIDHVRVVEAIVRGGEVIRMGSTAIRVDAKGLRAPAPTSAVNRFGGLIGSSPEMRALYATCARVARADVPVVIEGETGTGKEVLAEALHAASARAGGPFVVFDCTTVAPNLVESELFGHERGAFTGALAQRQGVFEQADRGTLLIDEIGDLDAALQPKLLRALERGEVRRVGGDRWIKVNVRVLAATRRDLDREVQEGRFRDDLFFRLAVARLELPPLRARRGDVALLTRHLWKTLGGPGDPPYDLIVKFERAPWHGNVRELANAVARYIALGESAAAPRRADPPPPSGGEEIADVLALDLPFPRARDRILAEFERRYVQRVLALHGGNVTRAAEASGIGRRYFTTLASRAAK